MKQKIAEKEEEERLRREQGLDSEEEGEEDWDADPIAKRRMEREAQLKSDVENAANLLGTSKLDGKLIPDSTQPVLIGMRSH